MSKNLLTIILILLGNVSIAQRFPSQVWHEGKLVMLEGDTLEGSIMYNQETDLIQYTINNRETIQTFTPRKILYYEIFDRTRNNYRHFYSLPYSLGGGYKAPILFELIHEGNKLTLLSRESIENKVISNPYASNGFYTRTELMYTYYFLGPEGRIEKFKGKKRDLLWIMKPKADLMKKFLKTNNIKVDRRPDLVRAVAYYNSLFGNT